jgi:DNA (cytosine-5)-methyltransferase 1
MPVTVTDLFCGAGGSSLGAEAVANVEVVMAANHWKTAVEVHQAHFPRARHDLADISQADPRRYPRTDILIASPECTNHSQARGLSRKKQSASLFDDIDPAAERSRATMWDVGRFAEQIAYSAIIVENVVEASKWTGWHHWLGWLGDLGYSHRVVSANSMFSGVPQSRDRIFVVFWRKGLKPELEQETTGWCSHCGSWALARQAWKNGNCIGRYRQQWLWSCAECHHEVIAPTEPAAKIIDWSLPCPRIGDRTKGLAEATEVRIMAGLRKFGWIPITTTGAGNTFERTPGMRARPVSDPLPVQQCTATTALAIPPEDAFGYQFCHGGRLATLGQPHPTVNAADDCRALMVRLRGEEEGHIRAAARSLAEPICTTSAGGKHDALLMRNDTGGAEMVTSVLEPARTMTAHADTQSLLNRK